MPILPCSKPPNRIASPLTFSPRSRKRQAASDKLGKPVTCGLIPYGRSEAEQIATIDHILHYYTKGDRAILDVTHGLRHLPMLIQQIANLLPTLRGTSIEGIYYGALDLTRDDATPVLRMDGLQHISAWQNALAAYDYSGNSAALVPILNTIGISDATTRLLAQASFDEQTHNLRQYREKIQQFLAALKKEPPTPLLGLIQPTLHERLKLDQKQSDWEHRFHLATQALHNGDYLRAALYGYEAIFERILDDNHLQHNDDYETRKNAVLRYIQSRKADWRDTKSGSRHSHTLYDKYEKLRQIRNALTHGERGNEYITATLNNEDKLRRELADCLDKLKTLTL